VFWRLKTSRIILTTISTITWSLLSFPMEFQIKVLDLSRSIWL
jgi:hypothetical protein